MGWFGGYPYSWKYPNGHISSWEVNLGSTRCHRAPCDVWQAAGNGTCWEGTPVMELIWSKPGTLNLRFFVDSYFMVVSSGWWTKPLTWQEHRWSQMFHHFHSFKYGWFWGTRNGSRFSNFNLSDMKRKLHRSGVLGGSSHDGRIRGL